jgi:hypothetical protein
VAEGRNTRTKSFVDRRSRAFEIKPFDLDVRIAVELALEIFFRADQPNEAGDETTPAGPALPTRMVIGSAGARVAATQRSERKCKRCAASRLERGAF